MGPAMRAFFCILLNIEELRCPKLAGKPKIGHLKGVKMTETDGKAQNRSS
jgi:hypothetical protein